MLFAVHVRNMLEETNVNSKSELGNTFAEYYRRVIRIPSQDSIKNFTIEV